LRQNLWSRGQLGVDVTDRQESSMRRTWVVLGLIIGVGVSTGCGGAGSAPSSADVWAVVDGREIARDEVERAYRTTVDPQAPALSTEESLALKLDILEELITQEALLVEAEASGLAATEADVDSALAERRQSLTEEAFADQLEQSGITLEALEQGLRRELSVQRLLEQEVATKVSVTEQEISDFYAQNRESFNLTEPRYRIAQLVVTPQPTPGLRNRQNNDATTAVEAQEKIAMLTEQLEGGADFGDLILDYSEDPQSLAQGGDLGFITESALTQFSPQLRDAITEMEPGMVNSVNAGGTYVMLMLLASEPAGQRELSTPSVKDGILQLLRGRKETVLQAAYVSTVREAANVTNYLARQIVEAQGRLTLPPSPLSAPAPAAGQ
jgi:peptidyl-prolyl cis-trans isomerase SurA